VATDVGGVRRGLDGGALGALVPPSDPDALVDAIRRVDDDAILRERLSALGVSRARETTLDVEAGRVAGFLAGRPRAGADRPVAVGAGVR
jgi:glycosyltransferase involved in cell wall biosynthesis